MSLRRCFSSLGCPDLSLGATLDLAGRFGIPLVEVRTLAGTLDLPAYFTAEFGSPEQLAAAVKKSEVRIVAFNASLHLIGATELERAQLLALAPWAEALGVRWLRVFDGGRSADAAELAAAAVTLQWWRAERKTRGWRVDVMVETHDSLVTSTAIQHFVQAVPDVAMLWDAHHTWRKGAEDPVKTWRAIQTAVVHVHVKDSIPEPSARHPFTYVLPGDGGFPIAPLLEVLRTDGYPGAVSLEWEKQWHPYLPSLEQALRVAAERGWW